MTTIDSPSVVTIINDAARIKCAVPHQSFTLPIALYCAGLRENLLFDKDIIATTETVVQALRNEIKITNNSTNLELRAKIIICTAKFVPAKVSELHKAISLSEIIKMKTNKMTSNICRLVGFDESKISGNVGEYANVYRFRKSFEKGGCEAVKSTSHSSSPTYIHNSIVGAPRINSMRIDSITTDNTTGALMSPMSTTTTPSLVLHDDTHALHPSSSQRTSVSSSTSMNITSAPPHTTQDSTSSLTSSLSSHSSSSSSFWVVSTNRINQQRVEPSTSSSYSNTTNTSSTLATFNTNSSSSSTSRFDPSMIGEKNMRKVSKQKDLERKLEKGWKDSYETAYIIGSLMYDRVVKKKMPLTKFKSPEAVANFINQSMECELISGREICNAVKKGRVGQPPPKLGRKGFVDHEDFCDLASLVFTAATIEQINCEPNRMQRTELISKVGAIVNDKRMNVDNEENEIDDISFYRRIEKENASLCTIGTSDKRELLRLLWLTFEQQKMHYVNWEHHLIDLGFGHAPLDDEQREAEGNVVFYNDQKRRLIHIDEMGFSLDGSKNGVGGRPGTFSTNCDFADAGQPTSKSSKKVSLLVAANYAGEALPLLIVFPSTAKHPQYKMEMLLNLHQIEGLWGYKEKRRFSCVVGK